MYVWWIKNYKQVRLPRQISRNRTWLRVQNYQLALCKIYKRIFHFIHGCFAFAASRLILISILTDAFRQRC